MLRTVSSLSRSKKQVITALTSVQERSTPCFLISSSPASLNTDSIPSTTNTTMSPSSSPPPPPPPQPLAPSGLSRTFYKRQLQPPAIPFSSTQGKHIFAKALADGTWNSFFPLIEQFRTQDEPAFCGLASVAMVLNTLSIDPRRTWKGPWRWFHEEMLDCCHPLTKVKEEGVTLEQAACLARCNGAKVDVFLYGTFTLEELRSTVKEACSSGSAAHIIVSYSRREVNQTGDGHFSPIGGYSIEEDAVLILDTARFKYPPHWLPLESVYNAIAIAKVIRDSITPRSRIQIEPLETGTTEGIPSHLYLDPGRCSGSNFILRHPMHPHPTYASCIKSYTTKYHSSEQDLDRTPGNSDVWECPTLCIKCGIHQ